jgi:hypothetical protein
MREQMGRSAAASPTDLRGRDAPRDQDGEEARKKWKRLVNKVCFVGENLTREPAKLEGYININIIAARTDLALPGSLGQEEFKRTDIHGVRGDHDNYASGTVRFRESQGSRSSSCEWHLK